jgi:periplasmic protein CpxP/Spy
MGKTVLLICGLLIWAGAAIAQPADSRLHDALQLTATQEADWAKYRAAIAADPARTARDRAAQQMMATLPTPRRLALLRAMMHDDAAAFEQRAQAVEAFYATLTVKQQQMFDVLTAPGSQARSRSAP